VGKAITTIKGKLTAYPLDPVSLLTVASIPGVGLKRLKILIEHFGDPDLVLAASTSQLSKVDGIDERTAVAIQSPPDTELARSQLHVAENLGARFVTLWDSDYPSPLKNIYDPPLYLFIRGEILPQDESAVAVVGTRTPSAYGKAVTKAIARALAGMGVTIVSGMALGIDGEAHRAALEAKGRTLAVLGSGIDVIYPPAHDKLMQQIIEHGAVISEFPPGTMPNQGNFPRRNRIISGLTRGTLIVEAPLKSGALLTAAHALDQNREVFAVPGVVTSHKGRGTNRLIKQGAAALVESAEDILKILGWHASSKKSGSTPAPELTADDKKIWDKLSLEPIHIDELSRKLDMPTHELLGKLLMLELRGVIRQLPGKHFVRDVI
jgi:DNA processing protein